LAEGGALPYEGARHCPGFSLGLGMLVEPQFNEEASDAEVRLLLLWY